MRSVTSPLLHRTFGLEKPFTQRSLLHGYGLECCTKFGKHWIFFSSSSLFLIYQSLKSLNSIDTYSSNTLAWIIFSTINLLIVHDTFVIYSFKYFLYFVFSWSVACVFLWHIIVLRVREYLVCMIINWLYDVGLLIAISQQFLLSCRVVESVRACLRTVSPCREKHREKYFF